MAQSNQPKLTAIQRSESASVKPKVISKKKFNSQPTQKRLIESKSKHPSSAFLSKCTKEQEKLRSKIAEELRCHLLDLYDTEKFSDTLIIKGKLIKKVHRSILITRIPDLFEELLNFNQKNSQSEYESNEHPDNYCIEIPFEIEESQLNSFLLMVYSNEDIRKEEIDLIEKLKCFSQHYYKDKTITQFKMDNITKDKENSETHTLDEKEVLDNISNIDENEDLKDLKSSLFDLTENTKIKDFLSIEDKQTLKSNIYSDESLSRKSLDESSSEEIINLTNFDDKCKKDENASLSQDSDFEVSKTSQMVRSGTFELLSSINSEDNSDLKDLKSEKIDSLLINDSFYLHNFAEHSYQIKNENEKSTSMSKESLDEGKYVEEVPVKSKELNNSSHKTSEPTKEYQTNSMFSLFIDLKSIPEQKSFDAKEDNNSIKHNGLKFIPLENNPKEDNSFLQYNSFSESKTESDNKYCKSSSQRSNITTNSNNCVQKANPSLIRSLDSALTNDIFCNKTNQTVNDIPLLPMSPIFRRKVLTKHNIYNKTDPKINERSENNSLSQFESSIDPQDMNSITIPRRRSDSLTNILKEDKCFSTPNSLLNRSQTINTKTESSSASIESFGENEFKKYSFDEDSESLGSEISEEVSSLVNISLKNDNKDCVLNRTLKSCSKLGEDLLRMFIEEINTDIIIKVNEKEIKAHKCIIASRCQYFEAMLRGNWRESDSNYITLKGFSYNSVHFALCHLYGGAVTVPTDKVNLSELALLSDLLAMDSLKEVVIYELKVNYCHFFHNPCDDNCIVGVLNCLTLCSRCGLKDLYDSCMNWTAKFFSRVWSHKEFVSLSEQLMESCYRTKINQLLPDNVLNTTLDCEKLITSLPRVKWAERVFSLLAKLIEECCIFIAANYDLVITSKAFISLGRGNSWNISSLEETLLAAMTKLIPDVSCKSHLQLDNILLLQNNEEAGFGYGTFNDEFVKLVTKMQRYCERYMIQNANAVVHCESWSLLSSESQQRIKDAAVLVFEFEKATAPPPKLSSSFINNISTKPAVKKCAQKFNIEKCKDRSKGALSKKITNQSSKISGINTNKLNQRCDEHIYESVPYESVPISQNKSDKKTDKYDNRFNKSLRPQDLTRKKSQEKIAKVTPFTIKTSNTNEKKTLNSKNTGNLVAVNDLVAEIDAESNLVTHCLQEAEMLEQELTRKLHKNMTSITSIDENISHKPIHTPTHTSTHTSNSGHLKSINSRTTNFKTQSTSSRVKSGSLRTNNIRSQNK